MQPRHVVRHALLIVAVGAAAAVSAGAQPLTRDEQAVFLQKARIVSRKDTEKGVTRPVRMTLTDGTLTHDAVFSTIEQRTPVMRYKDGRTELDFVDSYRYTIAAYRLADLLGIADMMPVTIERTIDGQRGAMSWWVDDVKWDEGQRAKDGLQAPDRDAYGRQVQRMRLFSHLVADTDRNAGNILITSEWKLWMIDFTRAFRRSRELGPTHDVSRFDRQLVDRLRSLTKNDIAAATRPYLTGAEIDPLLDRRNALLELIDKRIAAQGEAVVLY